MHHYLEHLDGTDWHHDISRDVIPAMLAGGERVRGHEVTGYWEDIGTVERYHRAHRGLLTDPPTLTLADLPRTLAPGVPRRRVTHTDGVHHSVVAADLANEGLVEHSVVHPGVRIEADAHVSDCVLLPGARIPAGTELRAAIVLEDGTVQPCEPAPALGGVIP
ncbi:hypothetical protein [Streptomyces sp. NPDC003247]|uniref:hypothetical protein n=1 Tax=Streptomyces sp. NPDC003247 TaxID=3364677 RepID=UPI0036ADA6F5